MNHITKPIHDPDTLWAARHEVRKCYEAVKRLRQVDPTMRCLLDDLDQLCVGLSAEIESIEPEMELRAVSAPQWR